jgi:hypothetical protein
LEGINAHLSTSACAKARVPAWSRAGSAWAARQKPACSTGNGTPTSAADNSGNTPHPSRFTSSRAVATSFSAVGTVWGQRNSGGWGQRNTRQWPRKVPVAPTRRGQVTTKVTVVGCWRRSLTMEPCSRANWESEPDNRIHRCPRTDATQLSMDVTGRTPWPRFKAMCMKPGEEM